MRAICKEANELDGNAALTPEELRYILELPDANNKIKWIKADDIVKDSFKFCAKSLRADFRLNRSGIGWRALENTKSVRDRLAHPKQSGLLVLTTEEVDDVLVGARWFFTEFGRFMDCIAPK
jgi:hypothetical protein